MYFHRLLKLTQHQLLLFQLHLNLLHLLRRCSVRHLQIVRSSSSTNPDDVSTGPPIKLVRRSLSLNFDSCTEDEKAMQVTDDAEVSEEEVSKDDEILSILSDKIRQSIKEQERKAIEDQNLAIISLAKRREKMIACLPSIT